MQLFNDDVWSSYNPHMMLGLFPTLFRMFGNILMFLLLIIIIFLITVLFVMHWKVICQGICKYFNYFFVSSTFNYLSKFDYFFNYKLTVYFDFRFNLFFSAQKVNYCICCYQSMTLPAILFWAFQDMKFFGITGNCCKTVHVDFWQV